MDIEAIKAEVANDEETVDVPIFKKNGDPYLAADGTPATVGVQGRESKRYRAAQEKIERAALQAARRRTKLEPSDMRESRVALIVAVVTRWHGWESAGKPWPCTPENVSALLSAQHIFEQVEAGVDGHADFFSRRSKD